MFQNINPLAKSTAVAEILIMLLVAAIIGYLLGRLHKWWSCNCDTNGKADVKGKAKKADANYAWSGASAASTKDDLTKIEGIGPAINKALNASGVHTFGELASTPLARIREILDGAGPQFQIHDGETWGEQAALLRDGKVTEFEKLIGELKHGHRVS
jgi:predicted flap endonuclease-1-like 5' DNA nuclease